MVLASGVRLGSYTIAAKVGAGGMGEVYRATDTRLGREVAIKVLPPEVASDPDRLARFQREAQLLASLNHPNIAAIYGLDEADGKPFLVLELVEGEDLAERLRRGPIPVEEAIELATQMAGALEAAHEKGIVHRDLKPANVKLTPDGKVKILDFGLAKAYAPEPTGPASADSGNTPTRTQAATAAGMILGTAAYMSPEQARGKAVDKRADIWAFGVVLHEMLTGKPLFAGETASDTLAAVLTREPDFQDLPPGVPARVRRLLQRCLRKDPRERLRDIGDARIELGEPAAEPSLPASSAAAARPRTRRWLALAALLAVAVALAAGTLLGRNLARTEPPLFRGLTYFRGFVHSARFAPDGQTVIYGAAVEGRPVALFSTRTDGVGSRPIDVVAADVAGIARDGKMALLLGRHHLGSWLRIGTLAEVSLSGGTPRELLEGVYDADISPNGERFAVVVADGAQQVLQFPMGKELFRTDGWISQPRISPDGARVAFIDHPVYGDDLGMVKLADVDGGIVPITGEGEQYAHGLCWARDGASLFYSAGHPDRGGELWRLTPGESEQALLLRAPVPFRVQDAASDGRILLLSDDPRVVLGGQLAGDEEERVYTFWDNETTIGITADGTGYAGDNPSVIVNGEYGVYFRRGTEPPFQVATGGAAGVTPDGKFVFTSSLTKNLENLMAYPVGAGQSREIALGGVRRHAGAGHPITFSADGMRLAFLGSRASEGRRAYVLDLGPDGAAGAPRPVSPEGAVASVISPDGARVAIGDSARGVSVVPADGSGPQLSLPGLALEHIPLAWTADGTAILSWDRTLPPRIYRTSLTGGAPEVVREIELSDPAGVIYGWLTLSPDGRFHLFRNRRVLSNVTLLELGTGTNKN